MADIRIKDLGTTASVTASDDFMAVDGTTNGTRKLSAATPSFATSVTVPGVSAPTATNLTLAGGTAGTSSVVVSNTTAATTTTSGALRVAGGVGVSDKVWIGGAYTSTLSAGLNITGVAIPAITLQSSTATTGRNYFIGSQYSQPGVLTIAGSTTAGGAATNIVANLDSTAGTVTLPQTTASTNTTSGALIVGGGVGVGGAAFIGGKLSVGDVGNSAEALTLATTSATGTFQRIYNTATNKTAGMYFTNTSGDAYVTNAGTTNDTIAGSVAGALALRSPNQVILSANGGTNAHLTIASTGAATFAGAVTGAGLISTSGSFASGRAFSATTPSGSSVGLRLLQTSVSDWQIENTATTGALTFAQSTVPYLTLSSTGAATFAGAVSLSTAGTTVSIKSGTNAAAGTVTLSGGAATITSTAIDVNTVIVMSIKTKVGSFDHAPSVVVAAGSATIDGHNSDDSTYNWIALKVN